jgi:hypothetical protein
MYLIVHSINLDVDTIGGQKWCQNRSRDNSSLASYFNCLEKSRNVYQIRIFIFRNSEDSNHKAGKISDKYCIKCYKKTCFLRCFKKILLTINEFQTIEMYFNRLLLLLWVNHVVKRIKCPPEIPG